MKIYQFAIFVSFCLFLSTSGLESETKTEVRLKVENNSAKTIASRFEPPNNFTRTIVDTSSFSHWLRSLPLKEAGSAVKLYNGSEKDNQNAHVAVVDMKIGNKDLHQCADAIIRLRADYLFEKRRFDEINFHFTNGFEAKYSLWRSGKRIAVEGNKVSWTNSSSLDTSYASFWKYLEKVFTYAGTLSLSKELKEINIDKLNVGDVFILGGSPGHAIILVDLAVHSVTGEKIFILAQSYMPAQEIQILKNTHDPNISPWYQIPQDGTLETPEWDFSSNNLKRFE